MNFRNVLLVDDDEDDQEIFLQALRQVSASIECSVLGDPVDALEKLKTGVLKPDVIFLDLNMPLMSGQEFLAEFYPQRSLNDIPVIIFSTSSHSPTIQLTKDLGASDFITKPGSFEELVHILGSIFTYAA